MGDFFGEETLRPAIARRLRHIDSAQILNGPAGGMMIADVARRDPCRRGLLDDVEDQLVAFHPDIL